VFTGVESTGDESEPVRGRRQRQRLRSIRSRDSGLHDAGINKRKRKKPSHCRDGQSSLATCPLQIPIRVGALQVDCPIQFCMLCGDALLHSCGMRSQAHSQSRQSSSSSDSQLTATQSERELELLELLS
jgi:hypothetical protein